ncbi:MAG: CPBP family glutamic-type intramembrane protease [Gemmatimonadaceae bacterium]|jgi:hypothetical protein|nr:CPBP family glutamic-type intramembrane protease [Gemmatimonadaceae bacterium]
MAAERYLATVRAPRYAVLFALPLLVAYEGLVAVSGTIGGTVRNGADALVSALFVAVAGPRGPLLFGALLVGGGAWLAWRDRKGGALRPAWFAGMFAESAAWAVATAMVVGTLTAQLLGNAGLLAAGASPVERLSVVDRLTVSLGAGLYEELLFRVILVTALSWAARAVLGLREGLAVGVAVVASALVFSAFHYVGPGGDAFTVASFTFRAIAGVWFSALFALRGFGIAAWTHALYDIGVLLL